MPSNSYKAIFEAGRKAGRADIAGIAEDDISTEELAHKLLSPFCPNVGRHTDKCKAIAAAITAAVEAERAKTLQLAVLANAVMNDLEEWGGKIVPHLIDSDDNDGQFLRNVVFDVLGDYEPNEIEFAMMRPDNFTIGRATRLAAAIEARALAP